MSYIIDEKYDKKNIAVYCPFKKNKAKDKNAFAEVDAKWRNNLKNGHFGWLVHPSKLKQLKKIVEQLNLPFSNAQAVNPPPSQSPVKSQSPEQNEEVEVIESPPEKKRGRKKKIVEEIDTKLDKVAPASQAKPEQVVNDSLKKKLGTTKEESKSRRGQKVYRRAVSEDEESEQEEVQEVQESDEDRQVDVEEESDQQKLEEEDDSHTSENTDQEESDHSHHSLSESDKEEVPIIVKKKNNPVIDRKQPELLKKIEPVKPQKPQLESKSSKTQPVIKTQPQVNRLSNRNASRYSNKHANPSSSDEDSAIGARGGGFRAANKAIGDKYRKYKDMARRKPVNISDDSTDQEESSSSDYPSPSPVSKINNKIKELRELEKKLRRY